jgi:hypothetical protein
MPRFRIAPKFAIPPPPGGIANNSHAPHVRRNLLEQLQKFLGLPDSNPEKPVAFPPDRSRLSTGPTPTGSLAVGNTIGTYRNLGLKVKT